MPRKRFLCSSPVLLALLLILITLPATPALAREAASPQTNGDATAVVTGAVLNGMNGQPVRGARLAVEGTELSVDSDVDGLFRARLSPGTYQLVVRREGFEPQKVTGVELAAGAVQTVSVVLMPRAGRTNDPADAGNDGSGEAGDGTQTFSEAITVSEEAAAATEAALLTERQRAAQISDSIGSEEIGKITGSDAAGVLRRVTGVSLQKDKYAYVRGLGDRYSQTTLNGSKIPSTEFERKVVPLDLFPSDLLDKITVSKSYTVDKPGDFAAGMVELVTREFPPEQTLSIGAGLDFNSETTGEPHLEYVGGLGFSGSGGQPLPETIPSEPLSPRSFFTDDGFTREELEVFGEALAGPFAPDREDGASLGGGFDVAYGNTFGRLGVLLSATYENDVSTRDGEVRNFFVRNPEGGVREQSNYTLDRSTEEVREAFNANLAYRAGTNHQIQLRSLQTTLSTAEGRLQEGFFADISSNIMDFRGRYQEQEVFNTQLNGNHFLPEAGQGAVLDWRIAFSEATTDENLRQALYEEQVRGSGEFVLTDNAQSGFLYFNDLEDELMDTGVNWESFLNLDRIQGSIQGGLAWTDNERDFSGRRLRFIHRNVRPLDLSLPTEELFVPEFIGPNFEIREVTRPTDTYSGSHRIAAAYLQSDLAWGKWRFIGGVRVEDSDQEVITLDRFTEGTPPVVSEVLDTDLLPSLSLVYQLHPDTNLRFSASQTVNRPEFRELAPFRFTHIAGGFAVTGNPDLERALIRSFDARWEWFPSGGEVIAASLFFKDFEDPIEAIQLAGAEPVETFANVQSAENLGLELELRRNLAAFFGERFEDFSLILNYTFVDSGVTLDPTETVLTNESRSLVGQPDNVLNTILEWDRPESGTTVRLLANFVDDKVFQAGSFGLPDVIEDSRTTVDVVFLQSLASWVPGLGFKVSGSNLTGEERLWTQGGETFRLYEPGRSLGLSLSYKPF